MSCWIFLDQNYPPGACTWDRGLNIIPARPKPPAPLQFIGLGELGAHGIAVARRRYPDSVCRRIKSRSVGVQGARALVDMLGEAHLTVLLGAFGDQQEGELLAAFILEAVERRSALMAIFCMPSRFEGPAALMRAAMQRRVCDDLEGRDEAVQLVTFYADQFLRRHHDACSLADIHEEISEEMLNVYGDLVRHGYFPVRDDTQDG